MEGIAIFFLIVFCLLGFMIIALGIRIVRPYQKGVVERLGKFRKVENSGFIWICPFLDSMEKVDMRETVIDVPPQEVITKDNVVVTVDAVIYFQVTDPFKYLYNVSYFLMAITKLAQTNLRNVVGDMSLDESLVSRDKINVQLRNVLDEATDIWGTKIKRVEIQNINPPKDVTDAMHRQMKAERERRAAILEAEGKKQAAILESEGEKAAKIQRATGEAQSIQLVADAEKYKIMAIAEGEAKSTERVYSAIHNGKPTNDLIAIKYLEALKNIAEGKATKIFLPTEISGVLGSLGGIAELFKEDKKDIPIPGKK